MNELIWAVWSWIVIAFYTVTFLFGMFINHYYNPSNFSQLGLFAGDAIIIFAWCIWTMPLLHYTFNSKGGSK